MERHSIIQNIFHKIYVHPLFYMVAFLSAITGYLKDFSIFMLFVIVHEIGHILASLFYKWNISKIGIFPLGAITFFDEKINRPMKEEFIIAISGMLMQIIFMRIIFAYSPNPIYQKVNTFLLLFNLLPIYPLDGAKIGNIIFNVFFPFLKSYMLTLGISYGFLLSFLFIARKNLVLFLALILLLYQVYLERKKMEFLFHKFLLERYLYHFHFPKIKKIKGYTLKKMKRDCYHIFIIQKEYWKEETILKSLFDKKK